MKQVLQQRRGLTVVREVPVPACPPGAVLVANSFSVISSGTERATVIGAQKSLLEKARAKPEAVRQVADMVRSQGLKETRRFVDRKLDETIALGYSCAGTVVEVGSAVRDIKPGDRVACAGVGHASHAEVVAVPSNLCAKVPEGVPLEQAAFGTIAAIALHGVRLAELSLGERAAVIGSGLVGQIACRLLSAAGVEVIALDLDPAKVEAAIKSGASHGFVADERAAANVIGASGSIGVDASLVTAAAPVNDPLLLAAEVTRDRGSVVLVGAVPIDMPRGPLYMKELNFRVSRSYGPGRYDPSYEQHGIDYPISFVRWTEQRNIGAVLDLIAAGRLDLSDLIEDMVKVEDAVEAYGRITSGEAGQRGAIVLSYNGSGDQLRSQPAAATVVPAASGKLEATRKPVSSVRLGLVGPGAFASGVGPSASNAQATFGFNRVSESADALLEDSGVDAVVIATRHSTHATQSARALRAGKHVLVEKPLALTAEQLEEVISAANESSGSLTVGFNRRFSPFLQQAKDFLSGEGPMIAVYRVASGQLATDNWNHDIDVGGGRLHGEGCHFLDSLAFLTGSPIAEVSTIGFGRPDLPAQAADNLIISA
ncbi:MAG: bi-domain-containing oxidoreductase, partial [Solirubrobacterales bacterium]|nr:bi-domain-containing oxidoreductase [Solirubrobacterales bacterium]